MGHICSVTCTQKGQEGGGSNSRLLEQNQTGQMLCSYNTLSLSVLCGAVLPLMVTCVTALSLHAFTIMDQNRDSVIKKSDLRDTCAWVSIY